MKTAMDVDDQGISGFTNNVRAPESKKKKKRRQKGCLIASLTILLFVLALSIILLILALTVFKPKQPRTELISTTLEGVAPQITFPAIKLALNITVNLTILVENRNYASFKHGSGETLLMYRGDKVGDAQLDSGLIKARSSSVLGCRLALEADRFLSDSNMSMLLDDIVGGQVLLDTHTVVPGKVIFLGIIRKHAVSMTDCRIVVGFPDFKIKNQNCSPNTKL